MTRFPMMLKRSSQLRRDEVQRCYEQHGAALVAYASSILGDRGRAEDALQQVFFKLLKGNMALPEPARPYLFRAVRNTVLSMMQRGVREVGLDDQSQEREASEDGSGPRNRSDSWFEAPAELGYWTGKLESAIRALPPEQGEVLVMRIWGEMTFDEIAAILGISINTVASRYRYALSKLRERIQPFEVRSEHATK